MRLEKGRQDEGLKEKQKKGLKQLQVWLNVGLGRE